MKPRLGRTWQIARSCAGCAHVALGVEAHPRWNELKVGTSMGTQAVCLWCEIFSTTQATMTQRFDQALHYLIFQAFHNDISFSVSQNVKNRSRDLAVIRTSNAVSDNRVTLVSWLWLVVNTRCCNYQISSFNFFSNLHHNGAKPYMSRFSICNI